MIRSAPRIALGLVCLCAAMPGFAQDNDAGGMVLSFGLNQRFEATNNDDLATAGNSPSRFSATNLSFGFLSETRSEKLSLDLRTGLRVSSEDGANLSDPRLSFSYQRNGVGSSFDITANLTQSDIAFLRDLSEFTDADGIITPPDDLELLNGTGTRRILSFGTSLQWGETGPLGYRLSYSQTDLRYSNANASLTDTNTIGLGAGLRLTLSPVLTANLDLRYSVIDEVGSALNETTAADFSLRLARPRGDITTAVTATRADDGGVRLGLSLGRRFETPDATWNARVGLTQDPSGDAQWTGRLSYQQALPTGQISLSAQQNIVSGGRSDGRRNTTLQAQYTYDIDPLSSLTFAADYARVNDPDDAQDLALGSLSASYAISLTPDWRMDIGGRMNLRDTRGSSAQSAQTVFVGLRRNLSIRP